MRACILLLDSFGIGASQDATRYGDVGADTLGHIAEACALGHADISGKREGPLALPHMNQLGLGVAALASTGKPLPGFTIPDEIRGCYGYANEQSHGKDTPSGHWEIAGVPVYFDWGYFPHEYPSFPQELLNELIKQADLPGVLGNKAASGTQIIDELGREHIASGKPIVYTSGDSVFQIAAHEKYFGLEKLYAICKIARPLVDKYRICRVIARPFIGEPGNFRRTANRRDYATPPPRETLLDKLRNNDREVISIGKVDDIFAHQGITQVIRAENNMALFDATLTAMKTAPDGSLVFANFVDFDSSYGHRRDIAGYASALEEFDRRLPELQKQLLQHDLVIITADHGCDPTYPGSDHTREHIPILAFGPHIPSKFIGRRETFADIGQTIAKHLGIPPLDYGVSFL